MIKTIRKLTNLNLKKTKKNINTTPQIITEDLTKETTKNTKKKLKKTNTKIKLK